MSDGELFDEYRMADPCDSAERILSEFVAGFHKVAGMPTAPEVE